ncbi:hypothetical protein ACIQOW_29045 [Kitasatospora sp. NPDC091335]|uniref:hypothetical protein n=1 Tax=Kitasatospora sp. NPDC091335 TaxID=3364085 RepID=UPI00382258B8
MDDNHLPLGPWRGVSWAADTPPALDRHILRARHAVRIGDHWSALIAANELAVLADRPDAAEVLGARRGYLPDSPVNRSFAEALRERPEDAGIFGPPVVLSVRSLHWEPDWSDIAGPAYRGLVHEGLHAIGIQRAVEARRETQRVIARLLKRNGRGHRKLLEYAPELVTWTACRALPLETLHDGSRTSPNWTKLINGTLPAETERVADLLVGGYVRLHGSDRTFKPTAPTLGLWLELVDAVLGGA